MAELSVRGSAALVAPGSYGAAARARRRTAIHESAHVVAGYLTGRPVSGVHLHAEGGQARVASIRADVDPRHLGEDVTQAAVDDIAVQLIGDVITLADEVRVEPQFIGEESPSRDEHQAVEFARRIVPDHEARALVEVGRARARGWACTSTRLGVHEHEVGQHIPTSSTESSVCGRSCSRPAS